MALEHAAQTTIKDKPGILSEPSDKPLTFLCAKCGEENSQTWWPTCEWCDHEQAGPPT
jgi:DNA (cytosine-5)-methyltransferase 1